MAGAETNRGQGEQEKFSARRAGGAVAEYGGAAYGIVEALTLNGGGALVGGVIWLIGRWVRYSGK